MKKIAALFLLFASLALYPQQAREGGRLGTAINPAPVGVWERIGPDGGGIEGLAFNPANPNEILATYRYPGRVYKSTNSGLTWSKLADHYDYFYDIAINPANPNVIYMVGYARIYISADGGLTWDPTGLGLL